MEFIIKKNIECDELEEINTFLDSSKLCTIEQYPQWAKIIDNKDNLIYLICRIDDKIVLFCSIREIRNIFIKYAQISFGPVFENITILLESIEYLVHYLKNKGFALLKMQLALETGAVADLIEYKLNQRFKIKYYFDKYNWSSIRVPLSGRTENEIFKEFTKGHKSAIKKAIKCHVQTAELSNIEDLEEFCKIYHKMNVKRGIPSDIIDLKKKIIAMNNFLKDKRKGFILGVRDSTNQIIGGVIIVFQGNSARYYKGAADPEIRDLPVLHIAIWNSVKECKKLGYSYFDLWGYNHFVNKEDQIYGINRFKKGFGGEFLFYPKIINIELSKFILRKLLIVLSAIKEIKMIKNIFM